MVEQHRRTALPQALHPAVLALAGFWSRRFTQAYRIVRRMEGDARLLAPLRYFC